MCIKGESRKVNTKYNWKFPKIDTSDQNSSQLDFVCEKENAICKQHLPLLVDLAMFGIFI